MDLGEGEGGGVPLGLLRIQATTVAVSLPSSVECFSKALRSDWWLKPLPACNFTTHTNARYYISLQI